MGDWLLVELFVLFARGRAMRVQTVMRRKQCALRCAAGWQSKAAALQSGLPV